MIDITRETSATAHSVAPAEPLVHRIWPQAVVGIAMSATVVWTCILAYSFVS